MTDKISNTSRVVNVDMCKTLHDGFIKVKEYQLRHKLFNGNLGPVIKREVVDVPAVVGVLLVDFKKEFVLLVEQFRPALLNSNENELPMVMEVVAGRVDKNESLHKAAEREVYEETKCHIDNLLEISEFFTSVGMSNEKVKLYCGLFSANKSDHGKVCGKKDENEDIKTHLISFDKIFDLLNKGKINNAITVIALQWLQMNLKKRFNI